MRSFNVKHSDYTLRIINNYTLRTINNVIVNIIESNIKSQKFGKHITAVELFK